jgi:transcription antitermination factor NusG
MMTYEIGMKLPPAGSRLGLVSGPKWPPTWFCLTVAPQKERATRDHLNRNGIVAFYPSVERVSHQFGKKRTTERPIVGGYVYAMFRQQPQWDVLKRRERLITGVFCINGRPVEIARPVIEHLRGLTVESERLRMAREEMARQIMEAKRPRAGDKAKITEGPFTGFMVEVESVKGGAAWITGLLGGRIAIELENLERDA